MQLGGYSYCEAINKEEFKGDGVEKNLDTISYDDFQYLSYFDKLTVLILGKNNSVMVGLIIDGKREWIINELEHILVDFFIVNYLKYGEIIANNLCNLLNNGFISDKRFYKIITGLHAYSSLDIGDKDMSDASKKLLIELLKGLSCDKLKVIFKNLGDNDYCKGYVNGIINKLNS